MNYYKLQLEKVDYVWEPSKSTPSCIPPVTEIPLIIDSLKQLGVRSIVDFGCGNGRNSILLKEAFKKTVLVECEKNLPKLKSNSVFKDLQIIDYDSFTKMDSLRLDSALLCFVLHIIPDEGLIFEILETIMKHLKTLGYIVIVSPKNDSKYTSSKTANLLKHQEGYIKAYKDKKYSFYRNLKQIDIIELLKSIGATLNSKIISKSRNILIFQTNKK